MIPSVFAWARYYAHPHAGYYGPRVYYRYGPAPRFYGAAWAGGHWYHGWYGGYPGWWWIIGGSWYLYPAPIYPYPDPNAEAIASFPAPPTDAPQQSWYWCGNPAGYYPAVNQCTQPWQSVAAGVPVDGNTAGQLPASNIAPPPPNQLPPAQEAPQPENPSPATQAAPASTGLPPH